MLIASGPPPSTVMAVASRPRNRHHRVRCHRRLRRTRRDPGAAVQPDRADPRSHAGRAGRTVRAAHRLAGTSGPPPASVRRGPSACWRRSLPATCWRRWPPAPTWTRRSVRACEPRWLRIARQQAARRSRRGDSMPQADLDSGGGPGAGRTAAIRPAAWTTMPSSMRCAPTSWSVQKRCWRSRPG